MQLLTGYSVRVCSGRGEITAILVRPQGQFVFITKTTCMSTWVLLNCNVQLGFRYLAVVCNILEMLNNG